MKKLLGLALLATALACGDSTLGPVQTVDGEWEGTQNGIAASFNMTQTDSLVSGSVLMAGVGGGLQGTITGIFHYPNVDLVLDFAGLDPVEYSGVMSQTQAKINGTLNGSGFANTEVDVIKK